MTILEFEELCNSQKLYEKGINLKPRIKLNEDSNLSHLGVMLQKFTRHGDLMTIWTTWNDPTMLTEEKFNRALNELVEDLTTKVAQENLLDLFYEIR